MRALTGLIYWAGVWPSRFFLGGATLVVLLFSPFPSLAQAEGESELLEGGFTVPAVGDEVLDALEDFSRHVKNKAWEKAFHSMAELNQARPDQMLRGEDGVILPAPEVAARVLSRLPPEGREAYRLFHDAKARQIMEGVGGGTLDSEEELRAAEEVYRSYFLTSEGDRAADLLGDAAFQRGDFYAADRYWRAALEGHSGTGLREARLLAKRAIALHRAGDKPGFAGVMTRVQRGFAGSEVTLGGERVRLLDYLERLGEPEGEEGVEAESWVRQGYLPEVEGAPTETTEPEWQLVVMPEFLKVQGTQRNNYPRGKSMETLVPAVTSDGNRLYGNWFGVLFALDLEGGKLVWLTQGFSAMGKHFSQMYRLDPARYTVAAGQGMVAVVGMNPERINYSREPYRLRVHEAGDGKLKWETANNNSATTMSYAGTPLILSNEVLVAGHLAQGSQFELISLSLADGRENWKIPLGSAQTTYQSWSGYQQVPTPVMEIHGGTLYFLANNGALLAVNLKERRVEWAVKYEPPIGTGERDYYSYNLPPPVHEVLHVMPRLLVHGRDLFFNEARGARLYRVDTQDRVLGWRRPVDGSAVLVGVDGEAVYMLSRELVAYDLETMALRWASRLPMGAGAPSVVVGAESILVFTQRGIYQLSKRNGDVERIFRSGHIESLGGALLVVGERLICVSERAITAYPLRTKQLAVREPAEAGAEQVER